MTRVRALGALSVLFLAACEDDFHTDVGPAGRTAFANYVAVGTSISMGVRNGNNAVTAETQLQAWPALVANRARASMKLPLFRSPGCWVPVIPPISFGLSQNGLPGNPITPNTACGGLQAGLAPPFQNTAISGHTLAQALYQTPESVSVLCVGVVPTTATCGEGYRRTAVPLILPQRKSQVGVMASASPTFVSVELGANDLLGALGGVVVPGLTVTTETDFVRMYDELADSVEATGARALLMGLPADASTVPALRLGSEIYADRAAFTGFRVNVAADCGTTAANNYIFFGRILSVISAARTSPNPLPFTCSDTPGQGDAVLTPADLATLNALIAAYNAKIRAVADANDWAYATIGAPFNQPKPPFSVVQLMSGTAPFGAYVGLDGAHPSALGQELIANDAIAAINAEYGFAIPLIP